SSYLPRENHIIGKRYTQRIERTNLTLRSRLKRLVRKTIGFSKSEEMHDKVIGTFIEREFHH
ncbi:IS1 family transposase, partial [Photobacterium damselae]